MSLDQIGIHTGETNCIKHCNQFLLAAVTVTAQIKSFSKRTRDETVIINPDLIVPQLGLCHKEISYSDISVHMHMNLHKRKINQVYNMPNHDLLFHPKLLPADVVSGPQESTK